VVHVKQQWGGSREATEVGHTNNLASGGSGHDLGIPTHGFVHSNLDCSTTHHQVGPNLTPAIDEQRHEPTFCDKLQYRLIVSIQGGKQLRCPVVQ
jgi:hypothetical protein